MPLSPASGSPLVAAWHAAGRPAPNWTGKAKTAKAQPPHRAGVCALTGLPGHVWDARHVISDLFTTLDRLPWRDVDPAGLAERPAEALDFLRVVQDIDRRQAGRGRRNLSIHWQPFQPLPGTPMQWCPAGHGARNLISKLRGLQHLDWVGVRHVGGRTDHMATICTILSRSDHRGADLLEALAAGPVTPAHAGTITAATAGPIPLDADLPWDFITTRFPKERLAGAHKVMTDRLLTSYRSVW